MRQGLSQKIHLAVLEGVDPSPHNLCAAGLMANKVGAPPPSSGGSGCLIRLEVNPNFARGPSGAAIGAARLTVRASHPAISESLVRSVAALFGGA